MPPRSDVQVQKQGEPLLLYRMCRQWVQNEPDIDQEPLPASAVSQTLSGGARCSTEPQCLTRHLTSASAHPVSGCICCSNAGRRCPTCLLDLLSQAAQPAAWQAPPALPEPLPVGTGTARAPPEEVPLFDDGTLFQDEETLPIEVLHPSLIAARMLLLCMIDTVAL